MQSVQPLPLAYNWTKSPEYNGASPSTGTNPPTAFSNSNAPKYVQIKAIKYLSAGTQSGTLTYGTAGSATYTLASALIADNTYTATLGGTVLAGVTADNTTIGSNSGTLTIHTTAATPAGVHPLTVTIDSIINELLRDVILAQTGISFTVSASDIVIFDYNFSAATAGDADNPQGTNSYFEFRVTPPDTRTSAYNDGTITATSYNDVANEIASSLPMTSFLNSSLSTCLKNAVFLRNLAMTELRAWTQNGVLHVSGLTVGEPWYIYNLYGQLIYTGIATSDSTENPSACMRRLYHSFGRDSS